jgi:hypothetical protein
MILVLTNPAVDDEAAAFSWICTNEGCIQSPISAPEYDWQAQGIGDEELERLKDEWPEAYQEFMAMKARWPGHRSWRGPDM